MAKAFALPLTKKLSFSLHALILNSRAGFYKLAPHLFPLCKDIFILLYGDHKKGLWATGRIDLTP
jgi:hypothetical protein